MRPVAVLAGAALFAAPIAASLLLRPSPRAEAASAPVSARAAPVADHPGFPAPPDGAVVFSRELGSDALALGVVPEAGRIVAQASLVGPQGKGVSGRSVAFIVQGRTMDATACGPGCYRAALPVSGAPSSIEVQVRGLRGARWQVRLPAEWPPPEGQALLASAETVWRSLRSLSFTESLASGPGQRVESAWQIQAPDRLAYQVKGGWRAVVIGTHRWDRGPGSDRWTASPTTRLTQPVPGWAKATDAHILGSTSVRGRSAWRLSFYDPGTPGWFVVLVDKATLRTFMVRMVATAHFMRDDYGSFNSTSAILPPHQR